jgi:hypothetical protein
VIAGAAAGATEGGLSAGPGNRLSGATVGGTVGAVAPWALTRLGNPIKATPEAQFLMDKGVDLTPGQMNPSSLLGSVEEIGSKLPFIENARRRAQQQAVKATIRETGAPGSTVAKAKLENLPDAERLMQDVIDSYAPAYGTFENSQFYPRNAGGALADAPGVEGAFTRAAKTTDIAADQASRDAADAYMRNQLTRLPHADPMKELSFKELQELRTKLRAEARRLAGTATGGDRSELIRRGADEVSDVFGSQMNPLDKQALDAIDANYRQAMIVDDAMQRAAGREGGFTFSQGMGALRKPEGKAFGRGGTGEPVSDLIRAGKRVFDERTPATGLRTLFPLALAGLGFAKPAAIAALPLATLAATKGGRKFMGGGYAGQEKLVRALEAIRRKSPGMFDALVGSAASGSVVGD